MKQWNSRHFSKSLEAKWYVEWFYSDSSAYEEDYNKSYYGLVSDAGELVGVSDTFLAALIIIDGYTI